MVPEGKCTKNFLNFVGEYYNIFRLVRNWANKIINELTRLLLFLPLLSFKLGMLCNSGENLKMFGAILRKNFIGLSHLDRIIDVFE